MVKRLFMVKHVNSSQLISGGARKIVIGIIVYFNY